VRVIQEDSQNKENNILPVALCASRRRCCICQGGDGTILYVSSRAPLDSSVARFSLYAYYGGCGDCFFLIAEEDIFAFGHTDPGTCGAPVALQQLL